MKRKGFFVIVLLLSATALWNYGCNKSQNPVSANSTGSPGQVTMMSKYTGNQGTAMNKTGSVMGVDSIQITSARIVLKDIKLEGLEKEHENDEQGFDESGLNKSDCPDEVNFKTGPILLNLNLSGSLQQVTVTNIPYGTYRRIKYKIHSISQSDIDSLSVSDQAAFADFLADGGYSIIIEGNTFSNDTATSFTFKSSLNAAINVRFTPPIVVDSTSPSPNLTIEINSSGWFKSYNGSLLDPNDQNNQGQIEANIEKSVHVYKDCNRDGREDYD